MATSRPGPEPQRVAVELSAACDNSCIFCCREGLSEDVGGPQGSLARRLDHARASAQEVTLVGGEPTQDPEVLISAVSAARDRGFSAIGVQTHGRHLARERGAAPRLLGRLVDAGLTDLHLSIHGDAAAVHDYHVGVAGAWDDVLLALSAAHRHRLPVAVTTVVTRSSLRNLLDLPQLLLERGVSAWTLALPRAVGAARRRYEQVIPRLGMAVPYALRALDRARRRRLPAWIAGAPECLLGPFRRWALAADGSQVYAPACDGCSAKGTCAGLDPIYLARFGGAELRQSRLVDMSKGAGASRGAEAIDPLREAALRRLFVGLGRTAIGGRSLTTITAPPRSAAARSAREAG